MGSYGNIELMFNTLAGKFGGFAGGGEVTAELLKKMNGKTLRVI